MMRVLHVIPSLSRSSGGPSVALPAMAQALVKEGVEVDVITTDDDGPGLRLSGVALGQAERQAGGWNLIHFPKQTEFYKVSLPLRRWLHEHVVDYDVVHVHAVFSFSSLVAGRAAFLRGVPYLVRPLGVLNRWGMANRRKMVKSLSFRLLDLPMLQRAAAMHYTSSQEKEEAARFGLSNRQAVIPIGIDLGPFLTLPTRTVFTDAFPATATTRNILFLSRIDVKKGIDLLLEAFALLLPENPGIHLVICGAGPEALVTSLKQMAQRLGISSHVTWSGEVSGSLRLGAFASAEMFVLPSRSENFGIALLEAMAAGLPCVSSDQVALAKESEQAVKVVSLEVASISGGMGALLASAGERQRLAEAARDTAFAKYSLEAMGGKLRALYKEVAVRAA